MDIIKELLAQVTTTISPTSVTIKEKMIFSSQDYEAIPLCQENFHPITIVNNSNSNNKICFIDGGNNELLGGPNFSIQLIRVAAVIIEQNKTRKIIKEEYYLLAKTIIKDNAILFSVNFFPLSKESALIFPEKEDLTIAANDTTIRIGNERGEIAKIGEMARKFSELCLAKNMTTKLNKNDIIVLDNHLKSMFTNEDKYWQKLYDEGIQQNVFITGLCKTTNLLTTAGNSAIVSLQEQAPTECRLWYYYPSVKITCAQHQAEMYFVKLHEKSKYVFKFETYQQQHTEETVKKIIEMLAENSKDYIFPGYPYGLIVADKEARVSQQEKEYYKMKLRVIAGKQHDLLQQSVRAEDAHNVLDTIH